MRITYSALLVAATMTMATAAVPATSPEQSDEATIREIVANLEADKPDPHVAATLDWENAFGIRYHDLAKRDAFYGSVVKPQFKTATEETLEVRVTFLVPTVAVADAYWHVIGQVYGGQTKPGPDRWGRTTYIFTKNDGRWTEQIERVADLRLPYYHHLEQMPKPVPVPAATLQSYAGHYAGPPYDVDVTVSGDHLVLTGPRGALIAIPTADADFLVFFKADDTAEYYKLRFAAAEGGMQFTLSEAWGAILGTHQRRP